MPNVVSAVLEKGLCTGCGLCENACPTNALKITRSGGVYEPRIDPCQCLEEKGCRKCVEVCPGLGMDLCRVGEKKFDTDSIRYDDEIGFYQQTYTVRSANEELRFDAASGGGVSQFLIYLLNNKIIDGAVVTGFSDSDPFLPVTYVATDEESVLRAKSSKYCPVTFNALAKLIEPYSRVVVVGLPCHLQGLEKLLDNSSHIRSKVLGTVGIYCSSNRTFDGTDYVLNKYGIDSEKVDSFSYRSEGCLGQLKASYKNGDIKRVPYKEFFLSMRGFFVIPRCTLCIDHYAEIADISFGDLHTGKYIEDKVGIGSVVCRSLQFDEWLRNADRDGALVLNPLEPAVLKVSQGFAHSVKKGPVVAAYFKLRSLIGRSNPRYDQVPCSRPTLKAIIQCLVNSCFRAIGRRRRWWFLIRYIDIIGLKILGDKGRGE